MDDDGSDEPWEQLDVDDSDLISLSLRPCKRSASHSLKSINPPPPPNPSSSSSASPPLIRGPAGAVQAAMQRRTQIHRHGDDQNVEPIPTQEFVRRVVENGDDKDTDFAADPWLSALDYVAKQGADYPTPLGSIRMGVNTHRVAQVVAVIKSCTPNGLGDLMLTLKDPTGTIGASIHHTVLSEGDFGKSISVGAVLVLKKVAVFSPSRSACYLNITKNNMVQVISKDGRPVVTNDLPISSVNNPAPSSDSAAVTHTRFWAPQEKFPPPQESTEKIMNHLRQSSAVRGSDLNIEKHMETDHAAAPGMSCSSHEQRGSPTADVEVLSSSVKTAMPDGTTKMAIRKDRLDNEVTAAAKKANNPGVAEGDNPSSTSRPINPVEIPDDQEVGKTTGAKRPRQPLITRASLPEYTEEELDLFEFD
ncbi:hypothetical protein ACFX13_040200 [Malus domestica]|uniref:uncharacterized protein LOC126626644 n=1 Tax=Malus sylvestris TaxID=3752 RepID=UPI0021AD32AE|nr:uncharacterized protein LOC126626644 [Malus sylvestris]